MNTPTPQEEIGRMLSSYWITQCLHVAARLRLADLLKNGPKTADELAVAANAHPRAVYRLLRALASLRVFVEDDSRRFSLTPMAECLRSDVPGSQWAMALTSGGIFYNAWGQLLHSVQTGKVAFDEVYGLPIFDYLAEHPEESKLFDETMVGVHGRETAAMLDAYDFSGCKVVADIGGGNGSVLMELLPRYPGIQGILFDLPNVIERAKARLTAAGLADRCRAVAGSFFESVPAGADVYMLRHIIHDWDDEKSTTILRNIHRAMDKSGKLLLVESVIPPGNDPSFGKLLDVAMLVIPGGEERTDDEYRKLYESAGFRLTRIVRTATEICVIEGVKG